MKKALFLILLLALAGCGDVALERVPESSSSAPVELPPVPPAVVSNNSVREPAKQADEGENNLAEIKEIMKPADKVLVYPSAKLIDDGSKYQFVVGIFNNNPSRDFNAHVEIVFISAVSSYANDIYASKGAMAKWVKENNFDVVVPAGGFSFSPVVVEVPVQAYAGAYTFYVYVYDADKITQNDKDLYSEARLVVTVPST